MSDQCGPYWCQAEARVWQIEVLDVRVWVGFEGIPWGLKVHCDASYELSRVGLMSMATIGL